MGKYYNDAEIEEIAKEIIESLRPKHLTVGQIKQVANALNALTEFIVLREVPADNENRT